jgi:hypothetical protein
MSDFMRNMEEIVEEDRIFDVWERRDALSCIDPYNNIENFLLANDVCIYVYILYKVGGPWKATVTNKVFVS